MARAASLGLLLLLGVAFATALVNHKRHSSLRRRLHAKSSGRAEATEEASERLEGMTAVTAKMLTPTVGGGWLDSTGQAFNAFWLAIPAASYVLNQNDANGNPRHFWHGTNDVLTWNQMAAVPALHFWMSPDPEQAAFAAHLANNGPNGLPGAFLFYDVTLNQNLRLLPLPACSGAAAAVLNPFCGGAGCGFGPTGLMGNPSVFVMPAINAWCAAVGALVPPIDGWRSPWDQDEIMVCKASVYKLNIAGMRMAAQAAGPLALQHPAVLNAVVPPIVWNQPLGPNAPGWPVAAGIRNCGRHAAFNALWNRGAVTTNYVAPVMGVGGSPVPPNQPGGSCTAPGIGVAAGVTKFKFEGSVTSVANGAHFNAGDVANCP